MCVVLVTGFEPFDGEAVNPSFKAVSALPDKIGESLIIKKQIPVVFGKSVETLCRIIDEVEPEMVVMVGQAGGRFAVSFERIGINVDDARIADNEENRPIDEPIDSSGPDGIFATLPIKAMVQASREGGIPATVSNSAGTFVCNHLMYGVLRYIQTEKIPARAGFVHVPYLPEQVLDKKGVPSMAMSDIKRSLELAIGAALRTDRDVKISGGTEH